MHLMWKNKDFAEDIKFILFCQTDNTPDWWRKRLFQAYPSLDYDYTKSLSEHERLDYITEQMKNQAENRKGVTEKSIQTFQDFGMFKCLIN